ncbi:MAG: undecaprenyl-diphosphate phosphatase [Rickettsiales bacterium]|nr:undecaprenyl-diphosphate phosphatase [Rickettsiales bacterium]
MDIQLLPLLENNFFENNFFKALIMGLIEGITEFIPVSSTAHLLIASYIINFNSIKNQLFEIVIQFGAILAIAIVYRHKIFDIIKDIHKNSHNQKFVINIIIAFVPAILLGLFLHKFIKAYLFSPLIIGYAMLIGGFIILIVEKLYQKNISKHKELQEINIKSSLSIGLFQCLAMIPGVSRSGATIIGAMLLGVSRAKATEFSFFLAIPTIFSASIFDLYKNYQDLTLENIELIVFGSVIAFLSSLIVIKWLISFVAKNNFIIFAIYRIIIGGLIILIISLK